MKWHGSGEVGDAGRRCRENGMSAVQPNATDGSSVLSRYFASIRSQRMLTLEEELSLARRVEKGSRAARDELVEANLGFVVKIALEYRSLGLPLEDLLAEGNVGLLEAARRYDSTKECKFVTYAVWWVRKSILEAAAKQTRQVRVPGYYRRQLRQVQDVERQLETELGRRPRRDEIDSKLPGRRTTSENLLRFNYREISLEEKVAPGASLSLSEQLQDGKARSPEDDLVRREDRVLLDEALAELSEQERRVITLRFGLADHPSLTLTEIGTLLSLSRERIRQIENQAKHRLRRILARRRSSIPRAYARSA
jgi:RNA polymerase primary sigma factor